MLTKIGLRTINAIEDNFTKLTTTFFYKHHFIFQDDRHTTVAQKRVPEFFQILAGLFLFFVYLFLVPKNVA